MLASAVLVGSACSTSADEPATETERDSTPSGSSVESEPGSDAGSDDAEDTSDEPLSWGPTEGELAEAQELVSGWSAEQLAGQVIVGRFFGTDPAEAARMVRDLHLAGVSVTGENVTDEAQVREMTRALSRAVAADGRDFPAVIGVDQEGGVVSHLRGIATDFPSFATAGAAIAA
ncbi:MAG: glycoside hydrolase family 3 N-terminal domain-containing protein, partial [Nocardioides sp.]